MTILAAARTLAVLFWCMRTPRPGRRPRAASLTAKKLRRLEIAAGAPVRKGKPSGVWVTHERMRRAEKELVRAQASYERMIRDSGRRGPAPAHGVRRRPRRAPSRRG